MATSKEMRNIPLNFPPLIDDLSGDMTHFIITDAALCSAAAYLYIV